MKTFFRLLMVTVLLLTFPGGAAATSVGSVLQLTLEEAVTLALDQNPNVTLARNQEESARISLQTAEGAFLPELQASSNTAYRYDEQNSLGNYEAYETATIKATATINLFSGFANSASLAGSQLQLSAQSANHLRQLQSVAFEAATRFVAVLTSKELVLVEEENLENQKLLLGQIEAWYQAGSRSLTDLYRQQAETAQAELDLLRARRNREVAKMGLLQTLALPPAMKLEVLPTEVEVLDTLAGLDLEQLYCQALETRPDLRAKALQVDAAREGVREAESGYSPTIDLYAEVGSSYSGLNSDRGFTDQVMEDNFGGSVGLTFTIPIFDRDLTRTGVSQAEIGQSDSAAELVRLKQQVGVEVGQALADYQTARKQLSVAGAQFQYARQALAAADERFIVGASTWKELSDARTDYVQARTNEVNARYQVLQQGLTLAYYRGDIEQVLSLAAPQEK